MSIHSCSRGGGGTQVTVVEGVRRMKFIIYMYKTGIEVVPSTV